jgi:hypothetical protein
MQQRRLEVLIVAVGMAVAFALTIGPGPRAVAKTTVDPFAYRQPKTGRLERAGIAHLTNVHWLPYRTDAGGPTVRVSPAYGDPASVARRWTAFFESLVHGTELRVLDVYVAPLAEVEALCGSSDVLGCYGGNHLVMPDQGVDGISSASIGAHEYGHHIAFNRVNPPWNAIDSGLKRWATYERVCPRVAEGTAFPGAEDANYALNPGEAWAETYRVLNETATGLPLTWPIVDPSFEPDAGALAAAREDVVDPWTTPTMTLKSLRFRTGVRGWTLQVATPLDGVLHAQLQPGSDDITLLRMDGRPLVRGNWTTTGSKGFDYLICGQRTLALRVTRHTSTRAFTLRLSLP